MSIWHGTADLSWMNALNRETLGGFFGIEFTAIGDDYLEATMAIDDRHRQPFGLLHGGASVALAETVGSVASLCTVNRELFIGVGVEINANHLKPVTEGKVVARCQAVKVGGKVHVWDIRISDDRGELCCICRFTCMVVPRRKQ